MGKRFTETNKWDDPWYIDLPTDSKVFWQYLCDKCDNAGVIDISERHAKFLLNCEREIPELIDSLGNRIKKLENGKYFITSFVQFQFGQLRPESNLHKNVILLLEKHGLYELFFEGKLTLNEGLKKGTSKGKGNSKGKGEGKGKSKVKHLFKDSEYFDFVKFESKVIEDEKYACFDLTYYHESIKNWSEEGNKKINWIATAKNWMLKDYKENKAKIINNGQPSTSLSAEEYFATQDN